MSVRANRNPINDTFYPILHIYTFDYAFIFCYGKRTMMDCDRMMGKT